ncbi:hypothetical protein SAMN05444487_105121 [Marininema mesophilum]|uniref:Uncharacterized protein n=1 Tax=Marininema mesophilum TaxID=1048340 RepID=A0A1H2VIG6_9BACL|nr:hypothetical protein [Marininema mesophilum]SDW68195.1 hypothetical protein SAMN05444487_105121 [Marininema mesophilum]
MFDTKKGKYTDEENEQIIGKINKGLAEGVREREILREISNDLNRGFAGIMSHVRKLRSEYPERFLSNKPSADGENRLNSWSDQEEDVVIEWVNRYMDQGQSLSSAIAKLEKELNRTQGAIYQRIYTLRRKYPERFNRMPEPRPRRRRKLEGWQIQRPIIRDLDGSAPVFRPYLEDDTEAAAALERVHQKSENLLENLDASSNITEEDMVIKAFENRYGRPNTAIRTKLMELMEEYGHTRVSFSLFTLQDNKEFPVVITRFLEECLNRNKSI